VVLLVVACAASKNKVHQNIHNYYSTHDASEEVSSLLVLKDEVDTDRLVENVGFEERGQVVFEALTKKAAVTQAPVIAVLESLELKYTKYWIVNMIVLQGNYSSIMFMASHDAIREIHPNFEFRVPLETPDEVYVDSEAPNAVEWNVAWVNAPQVWALGYNGAGFTVAGADTGVQWNHPALISQYRGSAASPVNHNYNWWDAVHTTGSRCGASSQVPCDDNGHGTHTVGTMVGDDHAGNQIGVAPGANWIACRNMNAGLGTPQTYIECLQWFVAPTDLTGANPDPSKRPHVIGNSYGCPSSEGCVIGTLQAAVTAVVNAGIFFSVSAGNSGPSCSTASDPPAPYHESFSVGALGARTNTIASYSSRGPVTYLGQQIVKPDISAPGSSVRSSYPTNSYASLSGTSMASPHITGIIPLLYQARDSLVRDIPTTRKLLQVTATPLASTACGGNNTINNVYGAGGVNVLAAVQGKK